MIIIVGIKKLKMENNKEEIIKQWIFPLIIALVLVVIIKMFFVQTYVKQGNIVFINKFSKINNNNIILFRNSENMYLKRCVAVPGDVIFMKNSELFVNKNKETPSPNIKKKYRIMAFDSISNDALINYYKLAQAETNINTYDVELNLETYATIIQDSIIKNIKPIIKKDYYGDTSIFPHSNLFRWNKDNFGIIILPRRNTVIKLNQKTFYLYKSTIETYEDNKIEIKNGKFYLNNNEITSYTFQESYYFILNDNRSNTNDSRTFGLVPKKNIKGKKI